MTTIDDYRPAAIRIATKLRPPGRTDEDHLMIVFNNFADQWMSYADFLNEVIAKSRNAATADVARFLLAKAQA